MDTIDTTRNSILDHLASGAEEYEKMTLKIMEATD